MLKELNYPFDASDILSRKKSLRRKLLDSGTSFIEKKVAILGGATTNDIKLVLELFLLNNGIKASFYESEYNQYYQDAVFGNAELDAFSPDIVYLCTFNRNIASYPVAGDSGEDVDRLLDAEIRKYCSMWNRLSERYGCPIIQNNFEMPLYRLMGNRDAQDVHGKVNFITRLNLAFYEYGQSHENFHICDINYLSADYGLKEWSDPFYYYMYKYALNVNAIPHLAFNVANIMKSVFGKNKKGLVLDLDNTLWGGVIGEDGVDHIMLGPEEPEGQAYLEFQKYLKELISLGVVLSINSKNDEENALLGLSHPDSALSADDFVVVRANWESKDVNFKFIADSLGLLPESLVFVDDNPAERHAVTRRMPEVTAPEMDCGRAQQYILMLDRGGYFEVTALSADDRKRSAMYRENILRAKLRSNFTDYKEYLASLGMRGRIKEFEPVYMARIAQLTNKSNQFNLTTRRYTQPEIEKIRSDPNYIALYGRLEDAFGDNGVVSVVIARRAGRECHIDLWIMSCRVLKRDMEFAMMDALVWHCMQSGVEIIYGYYYPTGKNAMVKNFYDTQGFEKLEEDANGNAKWFLRVTPGYEKKNKVIKVEE